MDKILIVDDNAMDRELMKEILLESNTSKYEIHEADSGRGALKEIENFYPDLVLLDIQMFDLNGFDTLREIRKSKSNFIPILLVSSFTGEDDREMGLKLGATDFINKPFITEEVKARIAVQLELKKTIDSAKWAAEKTNRGITMLYHELEKKNEDLKRLDQLKSDFVSTVSHELRTPLAITMEGLSLIIDGIVGPVSTKQKEILTSSYENIERLSRIINDLLDISKIEAGKVEIQCGFVDFTKMLKKLIDSYQTFVKRRNITLTLNCPAENVVLYIDHDKIIQVLNNLLNNAYKFTDEGGSIEVGMEVRATDVVCWVKDSGVGIAEDDMKRLFTKFQQLNRKEGPGMHGTGLGLVISQALVRMHEGRIWAESKPKEGTTFFFTLPTYSVQKDRFDEDFINMIKDARITGTRLALIIIKLCNHQEIIRDLGEPGLGDLMNEILDDIRKVVTYPHDQVFLFNGYSIYTLLPDTKKTGAAVVLSRLRKVVEKTKKIAGREIQAEFKFGVAMFPSDAGDKEGLIITAQERLNNPRVVMIVDDEPEIIMILEKRFQAKGYKTISAANGKEALKKIEQSKDKPDIIVLDVIMPEMNGYELFGRLKENPDTSHIPVVLLTAHQVNREKIEMIMPSLIPVVKKTDGFQTLIDVVDHL